MRILNALCAAVIVLGLASCSQQSKEHSEREVGKAAYHAAQGAKIVAEKAGHELRVAGEQAHQGWKEAKHNEKDKRSK